MPRKPVSTFSVPVKVSLDELTTELLRRFPEADVANVITAACVTAERRLRSNRRSRHDRYHSQMFYRRMVERLPNPPESAFVTVGLKIDSPQVAIPGVDVRETGEPRMPTDNAQAIDELALEDPPADEFADLLDMPKFEDFEAVFETYPYAMKAEYDDHPVLVLGYLSARDRQTDDLIRRNCVILKPGEPESSRGTSFNDLQSVTGILRGSKRGIRQYIKVLPYQVGLRIRFWTHVRGPSGSGDRPHLNRYLVLTDSGIATLATRTEFDEYPSLKGLVEGTLRQAAQA